MPKTLDQELLFEKLLKQLSQSGPLKTREICNFLQISQPTFSRLIAQRSSILRIGRGPQTQYACCRLGAWGKPEIPVFFMDEKGEITHAANLYPIAPKGFYLESHNKTFSSRIYQGLPCFFEDLRPSGFLGRLVPKLYPDLHFPQDISLWADDDCLVYFTHCGWDLIGNYLIGEKSYDAYLEHLWTHTDVCHEERRATRYPEIAQQVLSQGIPGSSAAGEHPKFFSIRKTNDELFSVLVKFSPPVVDALSQRVADLLICEHMAHEVLNKYNKVAPQSCLVKGIDGRIFLEIERFDRNSHGGRIGIISLRALDLEFVGQLRSWSETAESLWRKKIISQTSYQNIVWLEVFGKLIGNSDRHHGNISFFCDGETINGLAPVYDMLPMMYAPQQNQLLDRCFEIKPPKFYEVEVWNEALSAARQLWAQVQQHAQISAEFKKLTSENEGKLEMNKI